MADDHFSLFGLPARYAQDEQALQKAWHDVAAKVHPDRFATAGPIADRVHEGILELDPRASELGSSHPEVISALGALYAETVSHLRPRVMVQGNPHYLGQASVVAEIRAILLAALRSAVLWRQLGGSVWDFLLRKRALQQSVEGWLG